MITIAKSKVESQVVGVLCLLVLLASCRSGPTRSAALHRVDDSSSTEAGKKLAEEQSQFKPGLLGTYFSGGDFTRPNEDGYADDAIINLKSLDHEWGDGYGMEWSGRWAGFIECPFSGEVVFTAKAVDGLRWMVGDKLVIDELNATGPLSGKVVLEKGKKVRVVLEFVSTYGNAKLQLYWEWGGQDRVIVPPAALSHDPKSHPDTMEDIIGERKK